MHSELRLKLTGDRGIKMTPTSRRCDKIRLPVEGLREQTQNVGRPKFFRLNLIRGRTGVHNDIYAIFPYHTIDAYSSRGLTYVIYASTNMFASFDTKHS